MIKSLHFVRRNVRGSTASAIKFIALLLLMFCAQLNAAIDAYPFPNEELQQRYNTLIDELRCPQCLNTNLAGSDSMIASDLRREVHQQLLDGRSDEEILEFMYQRYGDFILYKPRLKMNTLALWFLPFVLLLVAIIILIRFVPGRRSGALTSSDSERLHELIGK